MTHEQSESWDLANWKDGCPACDSKNVYQLITESTDGTNKVHAPWCEDCDPRLTKLNDEGTT